MFCRIIGILHSHSRNRSNTNDSCKRIESGRDHLKNAVLCYTQFERSIRHCMGFKITRPKNEQRNKMLPFFESNIKIYLPCLVSVVYLAYFIVSCGVGQIVCETVFNF